MINAEQIKEILTQYTKHGWNLRRVLLSASTKEKLSANLESLFGKTEIVANEKDAVWFSRISKKGGEAWELRRLSETSFALFEVFDDEDDEEIREERRFEMQEKLGK